MRVKELLQQLGVTQKDLAEKLGMTQTGLSLAISDDGNPPLKRLRQIADALDVSIADLFSDEIASDKLVAFIHCKGNSHTPTTIDQIMAVLKEWNERELHLSCHRQISNKINERFNEDESVQQALEIICKHLGYCLECESKKNK